MKTGILIFAVMAVFATAVTGNLHYLFSPLGILAAGGAVWVGSRP